MATPKMALASLPAGVDPPDMTGEPAARLFDWVFRRTLPFWTFHGIDRDAGGFHEALDTGRQPITASGKRAMVQARQIYVFSQAALLTGLPGARDAADAGVDFLVTHCRYPDGGWRFRVGRDGAPRDDTRDLYTQAFVLFALAWYDRLAGAETGASRLAAETIDFVETALTHPAGGFQEGIDCTGRPVAGPRRQNPHMHLLEACLGWYDATGDDIWLDRARRIADLFRDRFVVDGTLCEFFDDTLAPIAGPEGRHVEPGHHFEWFWLLYRLAAATGDPDRAAPAAFYRFAVGNGTDANTGGVCDAVDADGTMRDSGHRIWPQTEAIKAHLCRMQAGDDDARDRLNAQIETLFRIHLDGTAEGAWREHVGPDGALRRDDLPASSLYHLTCAAAELARMGLAGA